MRPNGVRHEGIGDLEYYYNFLLSLPAAVDNWIWISGGPFRMVTAVIPAEILEVNAGVSVFHKTPEETKFFLSELNEEKG
jgi:hypothetical protein